MNTKIYNISKKIIMMVIITLFVFIGKVEAISITSFSSFAPDAGSRNCTSSYCATDITSSGFRITMIDGNGNIISGTKIVNFWPNSNIKSYVDDGSNTNLLNSSVYSCTNNLALKKHTSHTNIYDSEIGIPDKKSAVLYSTFFNSLNSNKVTKIISHLTTSSATNYTDYYLKVEPIYIIKEKFNKTCGYYVGTTKEILNIWGNLWNWGENPSIGSKYVNGGCNDTIGGHWNVTRNYIVAMYYDCNTKNQGVGPQGVACYNSNSNGKLDNYQAFSNCTNNVSGLNNLYKNNNGLGVGYFKISDYVDNCQSRATASIGNKEALTKLYLEYKSKGKDYRNLLNFNNPKCTVKTNCKYSSDVGCFKGSAGTSINSNDLSCYNDTVTAKSVKDNQNVTGYCNVSAKFTNLLGKESFSGISGRMLIEAKEFSNTQLQLICTFPEQVKSNTIVKSSYPLEISDYITYKVDNGDEKIQLKELDSSTNLTLTNNSNFYDIKLNGDLYFPYKYAKNGSGEIKLEDCNSCKDLGYGYITKLDEEQGETTFTYNFKTDNFNTGDKTGTCNYTLEPEIVEEDKLEIEFRSVDTNIHYFTQADGNKRLPGENWSFNKKDEEVDFNFDGVVNYLDGIYFTQIINTEPYTYSLKYDMNKDGILNDVDIMFVNHRIDKKEGYQNLLIKYVFENTNTSFDKKKVGPIYKIILTPTDIKSIREYNESHTYDDYNMECVDGINCKSNFLRIYNIQKINIPES